MSDKYVETGELEPGMEVVSHWGGFVTSFTVAVVKPCSAKEYVVEAQCEVISALDPTSYRRIFNKNQRFKVLSEPIQEPTKPGSKVSVDGENFLQCGNYWINVENDDAYYWEGLCAKGEVTIIDSDPSWDKTQ